MSISSPDLEPVSTRLNPFVKRVCNPFYPFIGKRVNGIPLRAQLRGTETQTGKALGRRSWLPPPAYRQLRTQIINLLNTRGQRNAVFITYKEIEEGEAARRKRAAHPEPRPDPADVSYYRPGKPRPEQLLRHWHARALRAEAEVRMWRELEQIRSKKK